MIRSRSKTSQNTGHSLLLPNIPRTGPRGRSQTPLLVPPTYTQLPLNGHAWMDRWMDGFGDAAIRTHFFFLNTTASYRSQHTRIMLFIHTRYSYTTRIGELLLLVGTSEASDFHFNCCDGYRIEFAMKETEADTITRSHVQ